MKNKNVLWGLIFIAAAVYILLEAMNVFHGVGLVTLVLTAICIGVIIRSLPNLEFAGILFPIAFLCIIWDGYLGIEKMTPWPVLIAAALATFGLNLMFGGAKIKVNIDKKVKKYNNEKTNYAKVDTVNGQYVSTKVRFGGVQKYVESEDLRRVDISAFCGGAEVYLNKACIPTGEAIVTFDCKCSGIQLYVPRDWNVENKLDVSMGAVNFSGEPSGAGIVDLILIGNVSFCGIDIQSV